MNGSGAPIEARRSKRIPARFRVTLLIDSPAGRTAHPGVTLDLSEGGVRVQTNVGLALAQSLGVVFSRQPEPCRVAWVGSAGSRQQGEAGLQFLERSNLPFGSAPN